MDSFRILPSGYGFDFVNSGLPETTVNPDRTGVTWLNMATGEIFVCIDATIDDNQWSGQLGTEINMTPPAIPYSAPKEDVLSSFAAPTSSIYGIAFDGTNLVSVDRDTDTCHIHDGLTDSVTDTFVVGSEPIAAVIFDGYFVYARQNINTITVLSWPALAFVTSFSGPTAYVGDLGYDGTNLLIGSSGSYGVYIMDGVTASVKSSFNPASTLTYGITHDGVSIVRASSGDMIYVYDGITSTILDSFASPSSDPKSLTNDGERLISLDFATKRIYLHKRADEV